MKTRVPARRSGVVTALLALLLPICGPSATPLVGQATPTGQSTDSNASRQSPVATAPSIVVADMVRDLGVFGMDSLRARATPSAGLTAAAAYVAAEFQRLGLSPAVQMYPTPGQQRVDVTTSELSFLVHLRRKGKPILREDSVKWVRLPFQRDVYFAPGVGQKMIRLKTFLLQDAIVGDPVFLLAGPYTAGAVRQLADSLRDKTVLYVPPADADTAVRRQVIAALYAVAQGVVVAGSTDTARFATERARAPEVGLVDDYMMKSRMDQTPWAVVVGGAPLAEILALVDEDLERLRASATPTMRPLDPQAFRVFSSLGGKTVTGDTVRAPNVIGTLQGSDPALRDECLFIVAPLDSRRGDSDASALAGLLALARAFTQPGQQPRRSIVFLATSGGIHEEFWGAKYFVQEEIVNAFTRVWGPHKGIALALDRLRGWPGDSAMVDGLRDVDVKPPLTWVTGAHRELDLRIADGGSVLEPLADHLAFVRRAIPSLYIHAVDDARRAATDASQVVRGTRLVFALAQALANADQRPHWSTEGRRRLRAALDP